MLNVSVPICCTTYVVTPPAPCFSQVRPVHVTWSDLDHYWTIDDPPEGFEPDNQSDLSRRVHITKYGPDGPVPKYRLSLCVLVILCGTVTVGVLRS